MVSFCSTPAGLHYEWERRKCVTLAHYFSSVRTFSGPLLCHIGTYRPDTAVSVSKRPAEEHQWVGTVRTLKNGSGDSSHSFLPGTLLCHSPLHSTPRTMVSCTMVASYGAVLPLKAFFLREHEEPLERSKCPSPSSSLDDITDSFFIANHYSSSIWADADRLVLSLLQDSQQSLLDLEDEEEEKEGDFFFLDHLPRPIPVHPARVVSLVAVVTPAATNSTTGLARSRSAVW
jgi:hypothetical protein